MNIPTPRHLPRAAAFTLIEIVIVLTIISIANTKIGIISGT